MCGRFVQKPDLSAIFERLQLDASNFVASYNIAPTDRVCVIKSEPGLIAKVMSFGYLPKFAENNTKMSSVINSRSETAEQKPYFRASSKKRRTVIPASGFIEWQKKSKTEKQPFFIERLKQAPLFLAGLYDDREDAGFAILTMEASGEIAKIHHRVPVCIEENEIQGFLSGEQALSDWVQNKSWQATEVSKAINNPRNKGASNLRGGTDFE